MSVRPGAPYEDRLEDDGRVIVYEGHDIPNTLGGPDPKTVDQPEASPSGRLTQNGLFAVAARSFVAGKAPAEKVEVFEKLRPGIWVYNGIFHLTDVWQETSGLRRIFKFKLEMLDQPSDITSNEIAQEHNRVIPSNVKVEVWKRDKGACTKCGAQKNLHFDHIIPYSQGGSSKESKNIQILCSQHNLEKRDKIE